MISSRPSRSSYRWLVVLTTLLLIGALMVDPVTSQDDATATTSSPTTTPPTVEDDAADDESGGTTTPPTTDTWNGCVDPKLGPQPVTIGQPTTVCLVLANNPNWSTEMTYMRLHFQPIADTYSRFHVPQSYDQLVRSSGTAISRTFPGNVTVHAESQTSLSYQKWYFDGADKIFPYLTAIIDVQDGVVVGITWDNSCIFCTANECEPNTFDFEGLLATESEAKQPVDGCYVTREECTKLLSEGKADCDLLLYVVWTGTDSNGDDFRSSSYRFSAFPPQSWTDRVSQSIPDFVPQSSEDLSDLNPIN